MNMKYRKCAVLLAVLLSACDWKDSAGANDVVRGESQRVSPGRPYRDDSEPVLPVVRPLEPADQPTLFYANVITDAPSAAISKVAAAFKPEQGKTYDVEVRITAVADASSVEEPGQ